MLFDVDANDNLDFFLCIIFVDMSFCDFFIVLGFNLETFHSLEHNWKHLIYVKTEYILKCPMSCAFDLTLKTIAYLTHT